MRRLIKPYKELQERMNNTLKRYIITNQVRIRRNRYRTRLPIWLLKNRNWMIPHEVRNRNLISNLHPETKPGTRGLLPANGRGNRTKKERGNAIQARPTLTRSTPPRKRAKTRATRAESVTSPPPTGPHPSRPRDEDPWARTSYTLRLQSLAS